MYSINDIKNGLIITLNNEPYRVLEASHLKLGRGGAILQTKLKNLIDGTILNKNFKGAEKIQEAEIEEKECQFIYEDKNKFFFMDNQTFEQFFLLEAQITDVKKFLKEGANYLIIFYQNKPVDIKLPIKMDFKVTKTEPAVKGDTVSKATKKAIIETGFVVSVPLFIREGDIIKVDTRDGKYLERVNS